MLVSLSSEVLPQFREFERTMATALNAAVMPPVSRYVGVLRQALDAEGVQAPLLIMKSDGGVTSAATCVRQPVQTVLSGPAAGVIGARQRGARRPASPTSSRSTSAAPAPTSASCATGGPRSPRTARSGRSR